ncbi:hypothetical protein AALP_AA6G260000 [Arabis alpina]|uniref:Uncharacterized protein n=1 Tax=Arabis alpina TaxID=50452 RepID=A0A087GRR7_ARAAL|nr:hypothetical protein AALP_AA6G260000 [Arabis alpina]
MFFTGSTRFDSRFNYIWVFVLTRTGHAAGSRLNRVQPPVRSGIKNTGQKSNLCVITYRSQWLVFEKNARSLIYLSFFEKFRRRALGTSHCIFKIPEFLTCNKDNSYDYQPITVSIGPYHNGKQQLQSIEDHKHRFQEFFVLQAQRNGVSMVNLFRAVEVKEQQIRDSYSEDLVGFETEELIKMMVLDGCFLLTLLLIVADKLSFEDPILSLSWVLPSIRRDLLLLENQIPLFVLQTLLETANFPWTSGLNIMVCLNTIALEFFSYSFERASESRVVNHNVNNCGAEHLLDLIRRTFIPVPPETIIPCCSLNCGLCCSLNCGINPTPETKRFLKLVLSAKLLRSNGIKFERKKSSMVSTFLDISLSKQCELHIPEICLDNFISLVLLNCIAFEQFHAESPSYVTSYAMFMGSLINNERDAAFLGEEGIIQNYYGTDDEVCRFFKRITKDYAFDIKTSYLASVFAGVNEYTSHGYNVQCAGLKRTYCGSTWIICSSFAALALLLLTLLQVLYAAGFLTPRLQGKVNGKQG